MVAVGTSNLKSTRRMHRDLIIQNSESMRRMGLSMATRFDLDRIAELPWSREWFPIPNARHTPIIGSLDRDHIELLLELIGNSPKS